MQWCVKIPDTNSEFFCDDGEYDSFEGRFFLNQYSQELIKHADWVLSLAKFVFKETSVTTKVSAFEKKTFLVEKIVVDKTLWSFSSQTEPVP